MKKQNKEMNSIERKIKLEETINRLNELLVKNEEKEKSLLQKAVDARKKGIASQEKLAKLGIANSMVFKKRIQEMVLQLEIMSNMRDITELSKDFLNVMNDACVDINEFSKNNNFKKTSKNLSKAYAKVNNQTEKFDMLMDQNVDSFEAINCDISTEFDEEIDKLIDFQASAESKDELNSIELDDIDERIERLRRAN